MEVDLDPVAAVLQGVAEELGEDQRERRRAVAGEEHRLQRLLDAAAVGNSLDERGPQAPEQVGEVDVVVAPLGQELVARAVEAGVFGYLVKPFRESDLLPAIQTARARHEELTALREEADSLAEALAARKAIERAKGLLMEREGLTEQDAFARLRKASQISGRPLKVVAEALIATLDTR